jgi:hypothetical protein
LFAQNQASFEQILSDEWSHRDLSHESIAANLHTSKNKLLKEMQTECSLHLALSFHQENNPNLPPLSGNTLEAIVLHVVSAFNVYSGSLKT